MGNENSKKQTKNADGFEIAEETDNLQPIKSKEDINNAITVVREEISHLKSENISSLSKENASENGPVDCRLDTALDADKQCTENGPTTKDEVSSDEKQKMTSIVTDLQNKKDTCENQSINTEISRDEHSKTEKVSKKEKKKSKKASKKDKDEKKKEKSSKKDKKDQSTKSSLKEGKPVSTMVENETYLSLSYVPHRENTKETPSPAQCDSSSKQCDNKEGNDDNFSKTNDLKSNETSEEPNNVKENENENAEEQNKASANYLQETFDLIEEAQKSLPEPAKEDTATVCNHVDDSVSNEPDVMLATSYRRESQTIVDDIVVEHHVSTVSNNVSDVSEDLDARSAHNESPPSELPDGVVNRIVNDSTVTEVASLGDCVNITITTITTPASLDDGVSETVVLSHISSITNNNSNEIVNESVLVANTSRALNACEPSIDIQCNPPEGSTRKTEDNNSETKDREAEQKDIGNMSAASVTPSNTRDNVISGEKISQNVDTINTVETPTKSAKDKKKQKSEEKKLKKENKKKQKSIKAGKKSDTQEEPESPKVSELIHRFEDNKKASTKKLKLSLSKSSNKSDEEKKGKNKKTKKTDKSPTSPQINEPKDLPSPVKGIFDDVPVEIEVHDVDTVSLSSLSSDEKEPDKGEKVKANNGLIKDKEISPQVHDSISNEEALAPQKGLSTTQEELPKTEENLSAPHEVVSPSDKNPASKTLQLDSSDRPQSDEYVILSNVNKGNTQTTTEESSDNKGYASDEHNNQEIVRISDNIDLDTIKDKSTNGGTEETATESDNVGSGPLNTTELSTEVISDEFQVENQSETASSPCVIDTDDTSSKKKSKKESKKKKRGSKLFSFRNNSDTPKEKEIPQQDVSFEQDPQSNSPKERRRSFSEFLRPMFGNIFSKNGSSSSSKRKSKIEADDDDGQAKVKGKDVQQETTTNDGQQETTTNDGQQETTTKDVQQETKTKDGQSKDVQQEIETQDKAVTNGES